MPDITTLLAVAWVIITILNILAAITLIFVERRDPNRTIAWLLVLFALPLVGFLLYLLLGRDWRRHQFYSKNLYDRSRPHAQGDPWCFPSGDPVHLTPAQARLIHLARASQPLPVTCDNQVQTFFDGNLKFEALLNDIESAQHHIHLEYFIWRNDALGQKIRNVLSKKVQDGVEVRVLLDGIGSKEVDKRHIRADWKSQGIELGFFSPVSKASFLFVNHINHRKVAIIDGTTAYTGGFNLGVEYLGEGPLGYWRDAHVRIEGSGARGLQSLFMSDWEFSTGQNLSGEEYFPAYTGSGNEIVQINASGPDSDWTSIRLAYFRMISTAEKSIRLTTPYFFPDPGLAAALEAAALSGVEVRIMTPGVFDKPVIQLAGRTYMPQLLKAGAEFYEYQRGFIHSKMMTVDGNITSIGSANFDFRGMYFDFEVIALILCESVATTASRQFDEDLKDCRQVELSELQEVSLGGRFKESLARLASPLY